MTTALQTIDRPLTVAAMQAHSEAIAELLRDMMKVDVHYGIIPGCKKPSLWKPGAEKIASMFRINPQLEVDDLSTEDCVRYRVKCRGISASGLLLGESMGEASSDEEKYRWRASVCQEEFEGTASDRRRIKWKKGQSEAYNVAQVRTEPADVANTILKMAEKRSLVGMIRTVTGCSDIFDQGTEDLPNGVIDQAKKRKPPPSRPRAKTESGDGARPANVISEAQRKRLYAKCMQGNVEDAFVKQYLKEQYGFESWSDITRDKYDEICNWADSFAGGT